MKKEGYLRPRTEELSPGLSLPRPEVFPEDEELLLLVPEE